MVPAACAICTGRRRFCIHRSYPLPASFAIEQAVRAKLSQDFFGPSTSVFIGSHGYPNVRAGPLAALEQLPDLENPAAWVGKSYAEIITLRSMLLRSEQLSAVTERSRFTRTLQELALAPPPPPEPSRRGRDPRRSPHPPGEPPLPTPPPDTELRFSKVPRYRFTLSD